MSQAPPEIETMPMPGRSRRPRAAAAPAVMSMSSMESTRMTPRSANTEPTTRSSPTSAPVCARAVRADSALLPAFRTTTALPASAARRAARRNTSGCRTVSMKMATARVAGSSTRKSSTCPAVIIASLPSVTMYDRPTLTIEAKSSMAEELAPLWESNATGPPSRGRPGTELTGTPSVKLAKPRWFGPSTTMPSAAAVAASSACAARPASPASA